MQCSFSVTKQSLRYNRSATAFELEIKRRGERKGRAKKENPKVAILFGLKIPRRNLVTRGLVLVKNKKKTAN